MGNRKERVGQQRVAAGTRPGIGHVARIGPAKGVDGDDDERGGRNQRDAQHAASRSERRVAEADLDHRPGSRSGSAGSFAQPGPRPRQPGTQEQQPAPEEPGRRPHEAQRRNDHEQGASNGEDAGTPPRAGGAGSGLVRADRGHHPGKQASRRHRNQRTQGPPDGGHRGEHPPECSGQEPCRRDVQREPRRAHRVDPPRPQAPT